MRHLMTTWTVAGSVALTLLSACGAPAVAPVTPAPALLPTQTLRPVALLPTVPPAPTAPPVPTARVAAIPRADTTDRAVASADPAAAPVVADALHTSALPAADPALPDGVVIDTALMTAVEAALVCARQARGDAPLVIDPALTAAARQIVLAPATDDLTPLLTRYPVSLVGPIWTTEPARDTCAVHDLHLADLLTGTTPLTRVGFVVLTDTNDAPTAYPSSIVLLAAGEGDR